ncbi:MAG: ATP-binding protein [Bacteroidota bacterium]
MSTVDNVSIKFKPGAYNLFRSLKYKVWLALAEYVDNSVQSYLYNKDALLNINNGNYKFKIEIIYASDHIIIRDNAAGINTENIQRAFEPANIPNNNTGLNEFGMGMKTASIWLAEHWSVRTAAIDEIEERFIEFDLEEVTTKNKEVLPVITVNKLKNVHFTEITLQKLTDNGKNKQIEKLKKHITSIHRNLLRSNELIIKFNDEILLFKDPEILIAPYYKNENSEDILWKEEVNYSLGKYKVKGFIAILDKMSTSIENGFALFRRGRVIEGSHDEKYRPKSLSGQVGSPRYKRIFGELELEGFSVSFDKGSFSNPDELEYFLEQFKNEIIKKPNNILSQADNYRLPKVKDQTKKVVKKAIENFKREQTEKKENPNNQFNEIIKIVSDNSIEKDKQFIVDDEMKVGGVSDNVEMFGNKYNLNIDFIEDKSISHFYTLETNEILNTININCHINLSHPFFLKYDINDYSPLLQIIKSLVYAELTAPIKGTTKAGNIRINFNQFIRDL